MLSLFDMFDFLCIVSDLLQDYNNTVRTLPEGEANFSKGGPTTVVCADVAESGDKDDVTVEIGETGGRPLGLEKERGKREGVVDSGVIT